MLETSDPFHDGFNRRSSGCASGKVARIKREDLRCSFDALQRAIGLSKRSNALCGMEKVVQEFNVVDAISFAEYIEQ